MYRLIDKDGSAYYDEEKNTENKDKKSRRKIREWRIKRVGKLEDMADRQRKG